MRWDMRLKRRLPVMLVVLLVGCQSTPQTEQKAQKAKPGPARSLNMETLCKGQAALRYNTGAQKINVNAFEQFQGSYEMRGYTSRKERFICSFDADGQFLHLSMR